MIDARYLQRRISQKLLFAKQLISVAVDLPQAQQEPMAEAIATHLRVAYEAWLTEICTDRHHPLDVAEISTAVAIAAQTSQHIPAVLAECVELEKRSDSWLSVLLASAAYARSLINKPPQKARGGHIALVSADDAPQLATVAQLQAITGEFERFIDRYRESMQEF